MARKYTCPHCGGNVVVEKKDLELKYNCPVLTCGMCQKEFLMEDCKEIAISEVSLNDKLPVPLYLFPMLLLGPISIWGAFYTYNFTALIVCILVGLWLTVASIVGIFMGVFTFRKRRAYLKEERQRSQIRCADPAYMEKLQALGYKK